jgi:hypothetical protein
MSIWFNFMMSPWYWLQQQRGKWRASAERGRDAVRAPAAAMRRERLQEVPTRARNLQCAPRVS